MHVAIPLTLLEPVTIPWDVACSHVRMNEMVQFALNMEMAEFYNEGVLPVTQHGRRGELSIGGVIVLLCNAAKVTGAEEARGDFGRIVRGASERLIGFQYRINFSLPGCQKTFHWAHNHFFSHS